MSNTFPDALLTRDNEEWRAEFEFYAASFLEHRHDHRKVDLIICWVNNYKECPMPIIELSDPDWFSRPVVKGDSVLKELEYWKRKAMTLERQLQAATNAANSRKQADASPRDEAPPHADQRNGQPINGAPVKGAAGKIVTGSGAPVGEAVLLQAAFSRMAQIGYDDSLRRQALDLLRTGERKSAVARQLGVHRNTVARWVEEAENGAGAL